MPDALPLSRTVLTTLDPEAVRFSLERTLVERLQASPGFAQLIKTTVPADPQDVRRRLLGDALRLTESMAPSLYRDALEAKRVLGVQGELEIYQSSGPENAALHLVEAPILLEIQGRLMALVDESAGLALFGHELGHFLAHGPTTAHGATSLASMASARRGLLPPEQQELARRLSVAREITADRFGMLACQDLDAALRLEMIATTGLAGDALTWDTKAYLDQCRELMEAIANKGEKALTTTHPEHSLRAWATWLFSETDVYKQLTGKGPGTRTLAEIDARIQAMLGTASIDAVLELTQEPPAFLLECALACAVLVAQADGEVAQEELNAIEDAFASTVPGWSEFLDTEVALERFYETAGLVSAAGPDLARRLFLLASHIMGADDVVDVREVQMILSIGEAIGFAKEFRAWIEPTIAAMGGTIDIELTEVRAVPLPARKGEIREALDAFCDTVQRRGQARISPRRLLRIAGSNSADSAAIQRVSGLLLARGITAEPTLEKCPADTMMVLSAPTATVVEPTAPRELDAARQSVIAGLARLRDELISGDGRSPSVRLRKTRKGRAFDMFRLDAIRTGAAERALTLIRSGKSATLVTPSDAGRHDAAQACVEELRQIDRANTDQQEETGANDLYLGYPILVGNVAPRGTKTPGYGIRAPLVLYPVVLQRDGRGARGFSIGPRTNEEPTVNHSLLRVMFNKADLAMPDELLESLNDIVADVGQDTAPLLSKLAEVGLSLKAEATTLGPYNSRDDDLDSKPPFVAIEECALLGIFPQSSSDILQDYDALLVELEANDRPLDELLAAGAGLLPQDLQPLTELADPVSPGWPLVDADPSQRDVVAECGRNRVTVVDGPPGTGKSQVIVNLVADALRRGERVAVVAEKRAALDVVFQRLDSLGLGDAAAVVHDARDDRKALFTRIRERLEATQPRRANDTRLAILRADHDKAQQTLERRRAALAHTKPEVGLTAGQLLALTAAGETVEAPVRMSELDRASLASLLELAERLHPYADLWSPSAWWRQQTEQTRPGLHTADDQAMATLGTEIDAAIVVAEATETVLADDATTAADLDSARPGLSLLRQALDLATTPRDRELLAATIAHPSVDITALGQTWAKHSTALALWSEPSELAECDILGREAAVMQSYAGRFGRFFSPTWWRSRGALRRALVQAWPQRAGAGFEPSFLREIQDRVEATRAWDQTRAAFEALGVPHLSPKDGAAAQGALAKLDEFAGLANRLPGTTTGLENLGLHLPTSTAALDATQANLARREAQLEAVDKLRGATQPIATRFPWVVDPSVATLRELCGHLRADGARLRESDGWWSQLDSAHAIGRPALDLVANALPDADATTWREALTRAWACAHLDTLRASVPQLAELGTTAEAQTVSRAAEAMRTLDLEIRKLEADTIRERLDQAELLAIPDAKYRARRTPRQKLKEHILKEVGKSRRLMPLRQFVRTFSNEGLLDVVPCWLVSPETMAVLFPRQPLFDLVVFDEASQCTVQSGFPVTLRAKRVVVAGDDKQMPPTSFFQLGESDNDDDLSEAGIEARDAFAAESLLVLARNRCPHMGLKWHYRCKSEELIAYSNHSMYDGDLLTIPSTAGLLAPSALKWVDVPDGKYDSGLNRPEAERVVTLLHDLLSRDPRPTVGVVTFNLKQRQTILDAIDARATSDSVFGELWSSAREVDALDERPFVKNLESVQGDERDIIVFSLGHAPVIRKRKGGGEELYVPARFGPLGQRGGERRLNVAISRAKRGCYVVSSFEPRLLHVGNSTHSGPRLFKGYLDFAHAKSGGRHDHAVRILDEVRGIPRDRTTATRRRVIDGHLPLAAQIGYDLEKRGVYSEQGIGSSKFEIPLAVAKPGASDGQFALAILTDEGGQGVSAFDQYVHQPLVLKLRGWDVMHIDAAAWSRRRGELLDQIEQRLRP